MSFSFFPMAIATTANFLAPADATMAWPGGALIDRPRPEFYAG